jgi:CHASE1-domain containing sensor protein
MSTANHQHPEQSCETSEAKSSADPPNTDKDVETDIDVEKGLAAETSSEEGKLHADDESIGSRRSLSSYLTNKRMALAVLAISLMVAVGVSAVFLAFGLTGNNKEENDQLDRRASEFVAQIAGAWRDYEVAGLWVQESCRQETISREDFHSLYLNLRSTGLEFQVTSFNPNTTLVEREALEQESRDFYAGNYPDLSPYRGIVGLEPNEETGGLSVQSRSEQPFYFPVHLLEPVYGNEAAIDFDLYSSPSRRITIEQAISTWTPALTPRLQLVQETDSSAYAVILMHPGIPLPNISTPSSFSSMVIRIPDLIARASAGQVQSSSVYIFDSTNDDVTQQFLGGATVMKGNGRSTTESLPELQLDQLRQKAQSQKREHDIAIASRTWTIVVVALEGTFEANHAPVIVGGVLLFILCALMGLFVCVNMHRINKIHQIRARAEAERAVLVLGTAREAAHAERELNDFIA